LGNAETVPNNGLASRVEIWPATLTAAASAIVPVVQVSATVPQEAALAIAPVGPIESGAGISRVRAAGTGMRLEAAPEDTADPARAAAAVAALPACLEAEEDPVVVEAAVASVVVGVGADVGSPARSRKRRSQEH
jgi:hypothetical protein